jgi:hypothetical protein
MKTVCKVKIHKSKMKFPLISVLKIVTGSWLPEESSSIFPTYITILYSHKNMNSINSLW